MRRMVPSLIALTALLFTHGLRAQSAMILKTFHDASRDRDIAADVFYPSDQLGVGHPVSGGPHPVVVFGHGMAMPVQSYRHLVQELMAANYIVVLPKTEMSMSPDHDAFSRDLAYMTEAMIREGEDKDSPLYGGVAPRFAAVGHSMGGGASFWAATVTDRFETILALAPAEFEPPPSQAAAQIDIPVLVITGESDGVTSLDGHIFPIYESLDVPCKKLIAIKGGSHCGFANSNWLCNMGESILAPSDFIPRKEQHAITHDYMMPWLAYHLTNACDTLRDLSAVALADNRVVYQNDCAPFIAPCADINENEIRLAPFAERYTWALNGEQIPGEQFQSISTGYGSGVYQCIAELYNGCKVESEPIWFHGDRIETRGSLQYRVYEHPSSGTYYIEVFGVDLPLKVRWYSVNGVELETYTIYKNRQALNFPTGQFGLQYFSLESDGKIIASGKLIRN